MASLYPKLWSNPIRYFRWAAHEKPAIFFASIIGALGPIMLFTVPPLREKFGDPTRARIPMTYPSMLPVYNPELDMH